MDPFQREEGRVAAASTPQSQPAIMDAVSIYVWMYVCMYG
jgi:hypothetical protein